MITQNHIIKILSQQRALNFPVGTKYSYSNSNFTLAAEIVKAVSGQTLRQFTDSAIFKPLGMLHTYVHDDYHEIVHNRAYSYERKDSAHFTNDILSYSNAGATSLFTNIDDMAKWLSNFYLHKVGDQADIDTLVTRGRLLDGHVNDYALGISNGMHNQRWKEYSHGGADAGYRTYVAVYPDQNLGIAVFGNVGDFNAGGTAGDIADLLLKDTTTKATAGKKPATKDTSAAQLSPQQIAAMKPYLGNYVSNTNGVALTLAIRYGKLYFDQDESHLLLIKDSTNRYSMFYAPDVQFTFEPIRKDTAIDVHTPGLEFRLVKYRPINDKDEKLLQTYVGSYYCPELGCTYGIAIKDHHLVLTNNKYDDVTLRSAGPDHLLDDFWWMSHLSIRRDAAHKVIGFNIDEERVTHLVFNKID